MSYRSILIVWSKKQTGVKYFDSSNREDSEDNFCSKDLGFSLDISNIMYITTDVYYV